MIKTIKVASQLPWANLQLCQLEAFLTTRLRQLCLLKFLRQKMKIKFPLRAIEIQIDFKWVLEGSIPWKLMRNISIRLLRNMSKIDWIQNICSLWTTRRLKILPIWIMKNTLQRLKTLKIRKLNHRINQHIKTNPNNNYKKQTPPKSPKWNPQLTASPLMSFLLHRSKTYKKRELPLQIWIKGTKTTKSRNTRTCKSSRKWSRFRRPWSTPLRNRI